MTDVADSSRVMVDLIEVSIRVCWTFCFSLCMTVTTTEHCPNRRCRLHLPGLCTTCAARELFQLWTWFGYFCPCHQLALQSSCGHIPIDFAHLMNGYCWLANPYSVTCLRMPAFLCHFQGDNTKLVESTRSWSFRLLAGETTETFNLPTATGWQPSTSFNDTVLSVLEYWRREVRSRYALWPLVRWNAINIG